MFCTKCGRQLHDGDAFCAYCGAKVREELLQENINRQKRYEEVVFNPPFRAEAERRSKQISQEVTSPQGSERKRETVHFDWNLDGFPTPTSKRKEDFELNWDDVIDKRKDLRPVNVEKIVPDNQIVEEDKKEDSDEVREEVQVLKEEVKAEDIKKEEPLSIEDLERELFGVEDFKDEGLTIEYSRKDLERNKEQEFYTYNAKRDAFQELLDKERERVESIESQIKARWEEITDNDLQPEREEKKPLAFEEVFVEPKTPLIPPLREVSVALPPSTLSVVTDERVEKETIGSEAVLTDKTHEEPKKVSADEESRAPEAKTDSVGESSAEESSAKEDKADALSKPESSKEEIEGKETPPFPGENEEEKSKKKLRYSDVFPVDIFEFDDDSNSDGSAALSDSKKEIEEDEEDEEEYKGNRVIKALIVILSIIVAIELVIIGIKTIAPDSGFSKTIDNIIEKISDVFTGEEEPEAEPVVSTQGTYMDEYIREFAGGAANIGAIAHDADLKYDLSRTYAFEGIAQSQEYQNSSTDENGDGSSTTYGRFIVSAVINYYDSWKENNQDEQLIGINKLDIGEIRTSGDGYYVLNRVTYAAADGQTVAKYETVYLQIEAGDVVVNEVKEESV